MTSHHELIRLKYDPAAPVDLGEGFAITRPKPLCGKSPSTLHLWYAERDGLIASGWDGGLEDREVVGKQMKCASASSASCACTPTMKPVACPSPRRSPLPISCRLTPRPSRATCKPLPPLQDPGKQRAALRPASKTRREAAGRLAILQFRNFAGAT